MSNTSLEDFYKLVKADIPFVFLFLITIQMADAQQMPMHHQSASTKNIFLVMMDTMMIKMDSAPTGKSADADFMQEMIPHHEGAVEMAKYEIEYGKDIRMIQLAKSILAEQSIEIQQMELWIKNMTANTSKIPADFQPSMNEAMRIMMDNMPNNNALTDTDKSFASVMIPHHRAAIDMARVILKFSKDNQTASFAERIISSQQVEIEQMTFFLK